MKIATIFGFLFSIHSAFCCIPDGIDVETVVNGQSLHRIEISPSETVSIEFHFRNKCGEERTVNLSLFDQFGERLPVPMEAMVRFTDMENRIHPMAADNGGWWTQLKSWSILLDGNHRMNRIVIEPDGTVGVDLSLEELLRVPAGGEPKGWLWDRHLGYLPGMYHLRVRFEDYVSPEFLLVVTESTKQLPEENEARLSPAH